MQTLDIHRPEMPDLQFALLVTALCTSRLTVLNIPDRLRTQIFDRCWVLVHESPPPGRPEERVLDLRPWTDVTLEAIVETIRSILTEAGIRTLAWDHAPSDPTRSSTPEAQPLIDRLQRLYPQPPAPRDAPGGEAAGDTQIRMDDGTSEVRQLIGEMAALMAALTSALKRRAADLATGGKDTALIARLLKGADAMHGSGTLYLAWARHYAGLPEDHPEAAEETDEAGLSL